MAGYGKLVEAFLDGTPSKTVVQAVAAQQGLGYVGDVLSGVAISVPKLGALLAQPQTSDFFQINFV